MSGPELSEVHASQFALMLLAGVPPSLAVTYFLPEDTPEEFIKLCATKWPRKANVVRELTRLQGGKDWLTMSEDERLTLALKKHYNEMAFYLYNSNYSELDGAKKTKADVCREALEKKVAGKAGQSDPIADLYKDILSGKIKGILKPQDKNTLAPLVSE